jgi:HIV Tat-specific factor 1
LYSKLAEWSDNEEEVKEVFAPKKNKWAKVCVVKHAFTLDELEEDPEAYFDIKDGEFTTITLFDMEADGVVTIRFRDFESAEKFRAAVNGKGYAHRKLQVTIPEDRVRFKKSSRAQEPDSSDEETSAPVAQN